MGGIGAIGGGISGAGNSQTSAIEDLEISDASQETAWDDEVSSLVDSSSSSDDQTIDNISSSLGASVPSTSNGSDLATNSLSNLDGSNTSGTITNTIV